MVNALDAKNAGNLDEVKEYALVTYVHMHRSGEGCLTVLYHEQ